MIAPKAAVMMRRNVGVEIEGTRRISRKWRIVVRVIEKGTKRILDQPGALPRLARR
jgi:hypothetical protein